jgi:hypothetical protein
MADVFPLLLFSGITGGLVLLGLGSVSRLRGVRKQVTAAWLLLQALLWFISPSSSRWILSTWSPGSVLSGWLVLDVSPEIWWTGFVLALVLSGRMWGESAERREHLPLSGVLLILFLMTSWLSLASGSLLMTLLSWGINDVIWCAASLMSGGDGERVVIGTAVLGFSSLILWAVSLFLLQDGISSLWWLIQPTKAVLVLLILAAVMRVGFYPFHIVLDNGSTEEHTVGVIYSLGPIAGIGLLYRILNIPVSEVPTWLAVWAVVSAVWCSIRACMTKGRSAIIWVNYAILQLVICASITTSNTRLLSYGLALWLACFMILTSARGSQHIPYAWPMWMAALFLLASPPSLVLGAVNDIIFNVPPIIGAAALLVLILTFIGLMMALRGDFWLIKVPWVPQKISYALSYLLPISGIVFTSVIFRFSTPTWFIISLWIGVISLAAVMYRYGGILNKAWGRLYPVVEVLDGQWLYHSIWQGSVNLLNLIRVISDVIEGRGSLLWSLLILLIVILIVSSR